MNKITKNFGQNNLFEVISNLHVLMDSGLGYVSEYTRVQSENLRHVEEMERLQLMRTEILARYQNAKEAILAKLTDRNAEREQIRNVLTQAINSNDKQIVEMAFDLYKHFLTHNNIQL